MRGGGKGLLVELRLRFDATLGALRDGERAGTAGACLVMESRLGVSVALGGIPRMSPVVCAVVTRTRQGEGSHVEE